MAAGEAPESPRPASRRVLLVEDEADIRDSVKDLLEGSLERVQVTCAPNAEEGMRLLPALAPHLIVSDFRMPGMSGLDFLAEARRMAPATPRVLMTAFPDLDVALRAINGAHIHSFLPKPLDVEAMLRKVAQLLAREEARRVGEIEVARLFHASRSGL